VAVGAERVPSPFEIEPAVGGDHHEPDAVMVEQNDRLGRRASRPARGVGLVGGGVRRRMLNDHVAHPGFVQPSQRKRERGGGAGLIRSVA